MTGPSLRRLRVFVTVVDTGGITVAARSLDMAQSTVSAHIRQLEAEMGVGLVSRETGALKPTDAGEVLLGYARRVLSTYAEAVDSLHRLGNGPVRGTLSIGGTATAGEGVLPRLLVRYSRLHPLVDLDLRIDNTSETLRQLDAGEVGLVVAADAGAAPAYDSILIAEEPQVVIAAADHPLAGAAADPAVLRGSTVLVREHGSTTRSYQLELLERWGIPGARVWTINSTSAIVHAVAEGLGIACVTRSAAESVLRLGRVAELDLRPAPSTRPVHLILRHGRSLSRSEEEFVALAGERTAS
ncbi:LysR family transcriptional regulator [Pseudonocardia spinosispora]|uniref:LysR family transcriptional regulator n=1 Tax=Pseudonocardia spinosispora TaxID=103441 RepID=UPI0004226B55|nr:LysR family transcriptional regulator [Pseudonocardia spinosispora]